MHERLYQHTVGDIDTAKLLLELGAGHTQPTRSKYAPPGAYAELHDQYAFQDWMASIGAQVHQIGIEIEWKTERESSSRPAGYTKVLNRIFFYTVQYCIFATVIINLNEVP